MGSQPPKVSICIPTYKQIEFLKRTLDSVVIQSYKDYEVIVSDDSPDNAVQKLLEEYNFGSKLKFFKNNPSLGSPQNWNESIRHAQGEYIKILHHDDWFTYSDSLEEFVKMLDDNSHADFAFSATKVFHAHTQKERLHCIPESNLKKILLHPEQLFLGNWIGGPSVTIYRRTLNDVYDARMKWLVDIEFYIRVIRKNSSVVFSERPLITTVTAAAHAITTSSITKQVDVFEHLYLFDKIKSFLQARDKKTFITHLWNLLKAHNVKSIQEIRDLGYSGPLEKQIQRIVKLNSFSPRLGKLYFKIYSLNLV